MGFGPADWAKHRRDIRLLEDQDPASQSRCDMKPSCSRCHPGWYATERARHRNDRP